MCGLVQRDTLPEIDVGYALMPAFRGQGYAREAAQACVQYGHEVLGLTEIWGITSPNNTPSARVLQQVGLRDDGLHRLVGQSPDKPPDSWLFKGPRRGRAVPAHATASMYGRITFATRQTFAQRHRSSKLTRPALPDATAPDVQ